MNRWIRSLTRSLRRPGHLSHRRLARQRARLVRRMPAPTIWLFGKAGSGKSSVVRLITGADTITIGRGFRATTRHVSTYAFPDPEVPLMHFLDTRGLGEPGYDAGHDLTGLQQRADAMVITQRLLDFAVDLVLQPLRAIRKSAPDRPVLLALTCLHEAYPQQQHPPYPFRAGLVPAESPENVERAITTHQAAFDGLVDAIVPVDITAADEGFAEPDYGGEYLLETLTDLLPAAYQHSMRGMSWLRTELRELHEQAAAPYIHRSALLAAAAALTPIPWVDLPVVAAIQARMVRELSRIYHQRGSLHQLVELLTGAGLGMAARMGVRELVKFVPYAGTIAGGALGATMAYAYTYALGRVACWYYSRVQAGHEPTRAEIRAVFQNHWSEGRALWKSMHKTRE